MKYIEAEKLFKKCRNQEKGYVLPGRLGQTRLVRTSNGFGVKLHATIVVEIHSDGTYTLNSGGWLTPTTKERINLYAPVIIHQSKNVWYLGSEIPFFDGIRVNSRGKVLSAIPKKATQHQKNEAVAENYSKKYAAEVLSGNFKRPSGGDCWYCAMKTEDGKNFGDASSNDHIRQHVKENYFVPALLWNALKETGYQPEYVWRSVVEDKPNKNRIKKLVKRYVLRRLNTEVVRNQPIVVGKPTLQLVRGAK